MKSHPPQRPRGRLPLHAAALALALAPLVFAQPAPNPARDEAVKLDVFTVRENPARAYGSSNLASATRLNTPAENVPQTISVLNEVLLKDISAFSYDQAVR